MKVRQEKIAHPAHSYRLLRFEQEAFSNPRHRHAHLELTWIEEGKGIRFVGNHVAPYASGDLVLIGPQLPHTWLSAGEPGSQTNRATVLQVSPALLSGAGLPELAGFCGLAAAAAHGLSIEGEAYAEVTQGLLRLDEEKTGPRRFAALISVLALLCEHAGAFTPLASQPAGGEGMDGGTGAERGRRIDRVLDWIGRHYERPLTVAAASAQVHVSPAAFSRYFRREVGKGFVEYVNDVRCGEACIRLAGSTQPVAGVARDCGFETLSNFNRQFRRRQGCSPVEFRRERRLG
jgi:AraC-like DNA-binding protein